MYITEEMLIDAIKKYGQPQKLIFSTIMKDFEFKLLKSSQKHDRKHDVTVFVDRENFIACIQKWEYKDSGIWRAPSGGAKLGETLEQAAIREIKEETNLDINLERFLLIIDAEFIYEDKSEAWTSYIFYTRNFSGEINPNDPKEIYDARWVHRDELLGKIKTLMVQSGWGGFLYRAFLTEKTFEILKK